MSDWREVKDAPRWDISCGDLAVVLVYGHEIGIQMGSAWTTNHGFPVAKAHGFNGEWEISHWMPLPGEPK